MEIKQLVQENFDYMVHNRRYLHTHPELSGEENNTVSFICQELSKSGIDYVNVSNGGVLGFIKGSHGGKTVLLRADIDALPISEADKNLKNERVCKSENDGVMHACGHDAHTSMLLCAGKILNENISELSGNIILAFERGEEGTGNVKYLMQYINDHNIHYDACFGMHVEQKLPTGVFAISEGNVNAGAIPINIKITGRGGHGSRPDLAHNPIDCMQAILNEISNIRMKCISPFEQLTTTICVANAGTKGNIIPDTAVIMGSARYFSDKNARQPFLKQMDIITSTIGSSYGCTVENLGSGGASPIINDSKCSEIAKKAIIKYLGEDAWIAEGQTMGSESFPAYMTKAPGCYGNLGIANEQVGSGAEIHNQYFDVDEKAMILGASAHISFAVEYLNENQ